ncbi:DNA replication endonuclease-helicase Dna2, partial [Linderina macrospora]
MHGSAEKGAPFKLSSNGSRDGGGDDMVAISKVLAIEENVWSPKFGLNGKIDLTIQTKYRDGTTLVEPMELKTGRNSQNAAHRAQLVLYTLLLSDRYDVDVGSGILYYPRPNDLFRIPRLVEELQGLMAARNDMTTYIAHAHQTPRPLPAPIGNEFTCKFCSFAPTCFVVHRAMENGTLKSAKVPAAMWDPAVEHLAESHLAFVRKWMALIDGEESDMQRFRSELWKMSAEQREAQTGRCLANMALEPGSFEDSGVFGSYSRYKQALVPAGGEPRASMLDSQLSVGDPIIISSEKGHYAFALGYILSFEFNRVVVAINLPVRGIPQRLDGFDPQRNQDFAPIMEIRARHTARGLEDETVVHPLVPEGAAMAEMTFRLDKDEMSNGMSRIRANIMRMFVEKNGDRKARARIVDLEQPSFVALEESVEARVATAQQADSLNAGQVRVLRRVLAAEDYALVMGMPGTGKTTTIAALVDVLVSLGKSVLLASYTHVAVDNILLKLDERKVPFVRLGNTTKVDPRIHKYTPSNANLSSVHQLDEYFRKAPVVATTCLGVTHPLFAIRKFDYCIVDEASQITLPVCLGPLLAAHRFVLVGDHYQLPPL